MREIKFRAWDKTKELMLYNVQNAYDTLSTAMITDSLGSDIEYEESCFGGYLDDERYVVLQYTGLKDKNGVEIYEGDILSVVELSEEDISEYVGPVVWKDYSWIVVEREIVDAPLTLYDDTQKWVNGASEVEVIGNIYENPELLNKL